MHSFYRKYQALNAGLACGTGLFARWSDAGLAFSGRRCKGAKPLRYPRIGIYAGEGSSHSWLWFVDLFERAGFWDLSFMTEDGVRSGALAELDVLAMSGGDTFMTAEVLGPQGALEMRAFVERGGLYLGACAGAYRPMNSSKRPLDLFNFVPVKITNLAGNLPRAEKLPHKFCAAYGCAYIFHPVRENVVIRTAARPPFTADSVIEAPLYGGPGMIAARDEDVLARYEAFTPRTVFLVDQGLARQALLGKAAIIRCRLGNGCLYLFGPHLEHPRFPSANRMVADAVLWDQPRAAEREGSAACPTLAAGQAGPLLRELRRELSNARIVAVGLEFLPVRWLIGAKTYEPEKIRVFIEALWRRLRDMEQRRPLAAESGEAEEALRSARRTTLLLRRLKALIEEGGDSLALAADLFRELHLFSTRFLRIYFRSVLGGLRAARKSTFPRNGEGRVPPRAAARSMSEVLQPQTHC